MGGAASQNGTTLEFYDVNGNPDPTKPALFFAQASITAQPQQNGIGSQDWLKEVYLAPDEASLYQLMRTYPPTGTTPPLTSGASQQVMVYYMDKRRVIQGHLYRSVVGLGTDYTITGPGGMPETLRVFDTFEVTDGDASNPLNGLYPDFHNSVQALELDET